MKKTKGSIKFDKWFGVRFIYHPCRKVVLAIVANITCPLFGKMDFAKRYMYTTNNMPKRSGMYLNNISGDMVERKENSATYICAIG
jgi:hypothetical protein